MTPILHPAHAAAPTRSSWTDHNLVRPLLEAMALLDGQAFKLDGLGATDEASALGRITTRYVPSIHRWTRDDPTSRTKATGGACVDLWERLDAIRDEWITAHLAAEGLRSDLIGIGVDGDLHAERQAEIEAQAVTVADLWDRGIPDADPYIAAGVIHAMAGGRSAAA